MRFRCLWQYLWTNCPVVKSLEVSVSALNENEATLQTQFIPFNSSTDLLIIVIYLLLLENSLDNKVNGAGNATNPGI